MKEKIQTAIYTLAFSGSISIVYYYKLYKALDELERKQNLEAERLTTLENTEKKITYYNGYTSSRLINNNSNLSNVRFNSNWDQRSYQQAINFLEKQQKARADTIRNQHNEELIKLHNILLELSKKINKQHDTISNNEQRLVLLENTVTNETINIKQRISGLEQENREASSNWSYIYNNINSLYKRQDELKDLQVTQKSNLEVIIKHRNQNLSSGQQESSSSSVIHLNDPSETRRSRWGWRNKNYSQPNLTRNNTDNKPDSTESYKYYEGYDYTRVNKPDASSVLEGGYLNQISLIFGIFYFIYNEKIIISILGILIISLLVILLINKLKTTFINKVILFIKFIGLIVILINIIIIIT